jgi:glycerol-3-phosphate dehydrogenase
VSGQVVGATVDTGEGEITVRADVVVSATGVWADEIRELDEGIDPESIRPAKGVHLTVPWDLVGNDIAIIISVPGDKRSLFLVPWTPRPEGGYDHCYIGTTDTDFVDAIDAPQTNDDDIEYVLAAINANLTSTVTRADVTGVWAGLRPLVKRASSGRTADLSRRHSITTSDSGVITVTGGKLTTYREMAEDTTDEAVRRLDRRARCRTKRLRLLGAGSAPTRVNGSLQARYGSEAAVLLELVAAEPTLGELLVPGLRYQRAEAVFAVRFEMATTLIDVLARRTRAHLQHREACLAAAPVVAELLARELGWSDAEATAQVAAYRALCDAELTAATVPDSRHSVVS